MGPDFTQVQAGVGDYVYDLIPQHNTTWGNITINLSSKKIFNSVKPWA